MRRGKERSEDRRDDSVAAADDFLRAIGGVEGVSSSAMSVAGGDERGHDPNSTDVRREGVVGGEDDGVVARGLRERAATLLSVRAGGATGSTG